MIDLFINKNNFTYKDLKPKININLYPRLNDYLNAVLTYFYNSNTIVYNHNILVKLLNILEIDYRWSDIDIIRYVRDNISSVIKPLGISNDYMLSTIHPLSTIVEGATELIYSKELTTITNYREINRDTWSYLSPLVFRNHNFRDLYFNHPSRLIVDEEVIVYDLDITKLAIMFKYYCLAQIDIDASISVASFVGRYVITNSIPSLADLSILNNYLGKGYIYYGSTQFIATTSVVENSKRLVKAIEQFNVGEGNFILEYLKNIELLDKDNAYDALFIEKYYETSRSKLYLTLTLLDYVSYIINHIDSSGGNSQYFTKLKYYINVLSKVHIYTGNKLIDMKYKNILESLKERL